MGRMHENAYLKMLPMSFGQSAMDDAMYRQNTKSNGVL